MRLESRCVSSPPLPPSGDRKWLQLNLELENGKLARDFCMQDSHCGQGVACGMCKTKIAPAMPVCLAEEEKRNGPVPQKANARLRCSNADKTDSDRRNELTQMRKSSFDICFTVKKDTAVEDQKSRSRCLISSFVR